MSMTIRTAKLADGTTKEVHLGAWKKDKVDARDFKLRLRSPINAPTPVSVDNSKWCSLPVDQGGLGSCTAHAAAGIIEYNDRRFNVNPEKKRVSRLFTYYATRTLDGSQAEDVGATMRDTIKSLAQHGCIKESRWWYNESKFAVNPSKRIWADAATDKITSYHRIDDGDIITMKQTLANGHLVAFGMAVFNDMLSEDVAKTGVLKTPSTSDECIGGHAIVLVGYDDSKQAFKVRNSWGRKWGQKGYFWMGYDYVSNTDLCNDFWVVVSPVRV